MNRDIYFIVSPSKDNAITASCQYVPDRDDVESRGEIIVKKNCDPSWCLFLEKLSYINGEIVKNS